MHGRIRTTIITLILAFCLTSLFAIDTKFEPSSVKYFRKAYPDYEFHSKYSEKEKDWIITVSKEDRTIEYLWAEGRLLPQDKIADKQKYEKLIYWYPDEVYDPATFTQKNIDYIKKVTSKESRKNSNITPPFFFDFIYESSSQAKVEKHIKSIKFFGLRLNVHERIVEPLKKIEIQIKEAALTDEETAFFVNNLDSTGGYNWRDIYDSGSRSFHSLGIAVDVLPKGWNQKNVYWSWRADWEPDTWMLLPLNRRWTPSQKAIEIFENNGFIWGGKWIVWDQMHFEYRPELMEYKKEITKSNTNKD